MRQKQQTPNSEESKLVPHFNIADIESLDGIDTSLVLETKAFKFEGKSFAFTVNKNAFADADDFYLMSQRMALIATQKDFKPVEVLSPSGRRLTVASQVLYTSLQLLEVAVVNPRLTIDGWIMLTKKVGLGIDKVIDWVSQETGMGPDSLKKESDDAGKESEKTPSE